ncbi:MAG: ABC transporter ATP-binding protein [Candidatus Cloacimonetes bacterium]|nr:ABC transporter ATP-binding protein [Candidatus Cloacimonadota bacterium]
MRKYWYIVRSYRKPLLVVVLVMMVNLGVSYLFPFYTKYIIDHVILGKHLDILLRNIIYFAILGMVSFFVSSIYRYLLSRLQENVFADSLLTLYNRVIRAPLRHVQENGIGYWINRIFQDSANVRMILTESILPGVYDLIVLITSFVMLFLIDKTVAMVCIIASLLIILNVYKISKRIELLNKQIIDISDRTSSALVESLNGVETIKLYAYEAEECSQKRELFTQQKHTTIKAHLIGNMMSIINQTIQVFTLASILLILGYRISKGLMTIGDFVLINYLYTRYLASVESFISLSINYAADKLYIDRVRELNELPHEEGGAIAIPSPIKQLIFQDVSFSYKNRQIVSNASFTLYHGNVYTVVGRSGIGKTTVFIGLLSLLYRDYKGEIKYNDIDIKKLDLKGLRHAVTSVNQEPFMFYGSIKDNIKKFIGTINLERMTALITRFNIDKDGDKLVNEKGTNISIGEKQRIAFVRSILRESDIYVFDEITSAQDSVNKNLILSDILALKNQGKLVIYISHDIETGISIADRVLFINKDGIVVEGSHMELLNMHDEYQELVTKGIN